MRIDSTGRFARDHRAHHIANSQRLRALRFRFPLSRNRIGRFARLRNQQRHRIRPNNRIPIAPLARVINLHRNPSQIFDHELPSQPRVPTRSASRNVDFLQRFKFVVAHLHLIEKNCSRILRNPPQRGFSDGPRLLINFFEHEMLEARFLRHDRVPRNPLRLPLHRLAVEVGHAHAFLRQHRQISIGEEE